MTETTVLPLPNGAQPGRLREAAESFSYQCGRCGACCKNREIPVNPFDVARLAEGLRRLPSEVLRDHVHASAPVLMQAEGGWCTFFKAGEGCTVHAHRPGVCRYYPLGRHVTADRRVLYVEAEPTEETRGTYGRDGVVEDYLEAQGVADDEAAHVVLNRFLDKALLAAHRGGALQIVDDRLAAILAGEGGFLARTVIDIEALAGAVPLGGAVDRLSAHLDELGKFCGLELSEEEQAAQHMSQEGRQQLFRLVDAAATIAACLGVAPGFSHVAEPEG